MRVLGIETSCDETGVAVYDGGAGQLIAHQVYSQAALHAAFGGVVPELASRDHVRKLPQLVRTVLADSGSDAIDGIAYTAGPGLIGALLVGAGFARSFAFARSIPAIGIHHLEGHLLTPMLHPPAPAFPFLALLVSGGHTLLVQVGGVGQYRILGQSVDDAVGEAFDKVATLLGLPYPGGAALARLATDGDHKRFHFPRPMTHRAGLDFSFSGLKTHTAKIINSAQGSLPRADIAAAFEEAVVDTLMIKCRRALALTGFGRLVVSGGVGCNQRLRQRLTGLDAQVYFPPLELCTDNGAMIAYSGWLRLFAGECGGLEFATYPRWSLDTLEAPGAALTQSGLSRVAVAAHFSAPA